MLVVIALLACSKDQKETPTSLAKEQVIPVTQSTAREVSQSTIIRTTGLIKAGSTTKYAFKIGGVVQSLYVDEGDRIKKGQLLATLYQDEIDAQYQQAQLAEEKARRDFARVETLYQDSIATLENYQNVKTQLEVAQKTKDQLRFNKQYARVYANADGYIIRKLSNVGEVVGPGSPIFISNDATNSKGYVLECTVNDRQWVQLAKGDKGEITLDAYPGVKIQGTVDNKSVQADPVSGAFRVEVKLSPVRQDLATGMYGRVDIITKESSSAVAIPYQALVQANGNIGYVYLSNSGKVERRKVVVLDIQSDQVLLASGITAGESVIVGNSAFLSPKSQIKIIE